MNENTIPRPTEPNSALLSDPRIPRIKFAGKEWPIPKLAIDQLAEVWPLITGSLTHVLGGEEGKVDLSMIKAETIKDMATVVYWGLRRGHPELSREEYDAMGSDLEELCFALMVVAAQTGGFKKKGQGDTAEGEAKGAPLLNGTPSQRKLSRAPGGRGPTSATR